MNTTWTLYQPMKLNSSLNHCWITSLRTISRNINICYLICFLFWLNICFSKPTVLFLIESSKMNFIWTSLDSWIARIANYNRSVSNSTVWFISFVRNRGKRNRLFRDWDLCSSWSERYWLKMRRFQNSYVDVFWHWLILISATFSSFCTRMLQWFSIDRNVWLIR